MNKHLVCSDPIIHITDGIIEYAKGFLTEVRKHSGDADMAVIVDWEGNASRLAPQFTRDLDELEKTLSTEDFRAEIDKRFTMFGVKCEPHISLGAMPIDDMKDIGDSYAAYSNGEVNLFFDKDSFRKLGKDSYNMYYDGKRFLLE